MGAGLRHKEHHTLAIVSTRRYTASGSRETRERPQSGPEEVPEMSTVMTNLKKWEDQYFTLVKRIETPVVRYTGEMAETLVKYVPARPRFMTGMPKVNEVVDNGLEFRRRMVNEQAAFTRKMMKACLLYTSDPADERSRVNLGGRRNIKKKKKKRKAE